MVIRGNLSKAMSYNVLTFENSRLYNLCKLANPWFFWDLKALEVCLMGIDIKQDQRQIVIHLKSQHYLSTTLLTFIDHLYMNPTRGFVQCKN